MLFHVYITGQHSPLTANPVDDLELACKIAAVAHDQYVPNYRMYEVREVQTNKLRCRIFTSDEYREGKMWQRDYIERFD